MVGRFVRIDVAWPVLAGLACSLAGLSGPSLAEPTVANPVVSIQGSTTFTSRLMRPYQAVIEANSGVKLDVIANKSVHGLVALLEGRTQMAMISSSLEGEKKHLQLMNPGLPIGQLKAFEVARTRIAFIVHRKNNVAMLSVAQLAGILRGEIKSWADVGGEDRPIAVVTVQPGGGVPTTVRTRILGGQPFKPGRMIVVEAPRHVVKISSQHEGALGIAQLGLVNSSVNEIKTDEPVEQILNFVTFGPPDETLKVIIDATRRVAADKLL
ncbi:MAG: substrate-binding domain-containing protein [Hyphomicrobiaceae bacterium]